MPALLLVLAASLKVAAAGTYSGDAAPRPASDRNGYPRTYHIWGSGGDWRSLARYDLVVGYAFWDVAALRRANPKGIFLLNPGLQPGNSSDYKGVGVTNGALHHWQGVRDRFRGGPKLGQIRAFDSAWDELYNADGSRAQVNDTWRHRGWNLADPAGKGTPDLVAKVMAHAAKRSGVYARRWDGIHSDNWIYRIGASWFYGSNLDTDRNGLVDDPEVLRRNWARGLTRVGAQLRAYLPGKIVGGNGNWNVDAPGGLGFRRYFARPDDHLRTANYTLLEELQQYTGRVDEVMGTVGQWLGYPDPRGRPRYFAILHRVGGPTDFRAVRWGSSLATIAGAYYEAYSASHNDRHWYDEYDGGEGVRRRHWLGPASTSPQKLPSGVWRRDFRSGIVLNNSTSAPQTIVLGTPMIRLRGAQDPSVNDGATVTEVTIQPFDGLFLRRP